MKKFGNVLWGIVLIVIGLIIIVVSIVATYTIYNKKDFNI